MVGIYKITNPKGKVYIGQSVNINKRKSSYKGSDSNTIGPKIYGSLKEYGWDNHTFEVIEECKVENLHERETHYKILHLSESDGNWDQCLFCNLHDVGSFGPLSQHIIDKLKGQKRTEDTKLKMRQAKLGKPSNFKGMKHSTDTKLKMRQAKTGKPSNRSKTPIIQYDLEGNFIKEWDSLNTIRNNGFSVNAIIRCCQKKQSKALNYIWEYKPLFVYSH